MGSTPIGAPREIHNGSTVWDKGLQVQICFPTIYGELSWLRAPALHAGGQGFESLILHHN